MKKALIVATVGCFLGFEVNDISILKKLGYEVHCATNFECDGENEKTKDIEMFRHQIDFSRSPFSVQTIVAYKQLKELLKKETFALIHCHTPVGGIITRLVAQKYRKDGIKVLYTAHGFHFFKGAPIKNWIMFYPIEKICSRFTDVLITINRDDYLLACSRFKAKENVRIPGVGIDLNKFKENHNYDEIIREELGLNKEDKIILSVGELNENKNHKLVIAALAKMNDKTVHYVVVGAGECEEKNKNYAKELGIMKQVHFLGYRTDIVQLDSVSDIFAFPSVREGLGLAAIEALACGTPVIGMNTRGINEYVKDGITGYLFENDSSSCLCAIEKCFKLINSDDNYKARCVEEAQKYGTNETSSIMFQIYKRITDNI